MALLVRQEVLDRAVQRGLCSESHKPQAAQHLDPISEVPREWLCRLQRPSPEASAGAADVRQKGASASASSRQRDLPGSATKVPEPRGEVLAPWIAKLHSELCMVKTNKAASRHRQPEAAAARGALQETHARQALDAYCHDSADFLRGPRFLRDKFGSALDGTEHRTDEVVMLEVERSFAEARELAAELRKASLDTRVYVRTAPRRTSGETTPPSPGVRQRADEALQDSEQLLRRCAALGWAE
ncbi:unnamed protein product, partial [Polarella glacialis]